MEEPTCRVTRARAKALGTAAGQIQKPPRHDQKGVTKAKSKRAAADENKLPNSATVCHPNKKQAVLTDVTNFLREKSQMPCFKAAKTQTSKQGRIGTMRRKSKVASIVSEERKKGAQEIIGEDVSKLTMKPEVTSPAKAETVGDASDQIMEPHECTSAVKLEEDLPAQAVANASKDIREPHATDFKYFGIFRKLPIHLCGLLRSDDEVCEYKGKPKGVIDIDSNHEDPQMCSVYASDIYVIKHVTELNHRPLVNYMETVQRDITQSMRGILIDWLVEVSEEYKLVPDTLYLTVNLIDRFLSRNFIEKQRLQLLGVTCMLIASKYEEICPPRIEEFCFITDNTYTKEEVVKMESELLNLLCFQLSVPTTKTFLRRYLLAAKVSYEAFSVDVEFFANYLAELTLIEYSFLKYRPSLIAASAVFLAGWTLDQSVNPWNPTLEHYTPYKALDLKTTVLALQELQSNSNNSSLHAIRVKYQQDKFNCVANLSSSTPDPSLFRRSLSCSQICL